MRNSWALAGNRLGLYMAWKGGDDETLRWSHLSGKGWTPPESLTDRQSDTSPALAGRGGQLYMAWKGGDDETLWWSRFDGNVWSPPASLVDGRSSNGPALS